MTILPLQPDHFAGVVGLQRVCFPPPFPEELLWSEAHLRRHLETFPEGQFVALERDLVVGSATSLIISEANWRSHADWETTTGGHFLLHHDPAGSTLFGVDVSVHPEHRGRGIARALYRARFDLVKTLGLARYGTACRIPDWQAWSASHPGQPQRSYLDAVRAGETSDRTLTPLLRLGVRCAGLIENHMEDAESGNSAAILEWTP